MTQNDFELPLRVYIEDTDAGGIVFYGNYLKYFERARTELIRALGFCLRDSLAEGVSYVVHSLDLKFHAPALLDDELIISARLEKLGKTYMAFSQQAKRKGGNVLVSANVKVACVSFPELKPKALDPLLGKALKQLQQG